MVIDFYGYIATGLKITAEDYNEYINSLILNNKEIELNKIIRKCR